MDSTREYRLCCWWKQGWGETACAHSVGADCGDQKNSLDWYKKGSLNYSLNLKSVNKHVLPKIKLL